MDKTLKVIADCYHILEYSIHLDKPEFYGDTISLDDLKSQHNTVAIDADCTDFKDADKVKVDEIIYIEDSDGDFSPVKVRD